MFCSRGGKKQKTKWVPPQFQSTLVVVQRLQQRERVLRCVSALILVSTDYGDLDEAVVDADIARQILCVRRKKSDFLPTLTSPHPSP